MPPNGDTYAHRRYEHCRAHGVEDEYSGALLIAVNHPLYPAVEMGKESLSLLLAGSEKQGTECWRQGEGIECRDRYCGGERYGELAQKQPRDALHERYGYKYGQQHDGRGDDGRLHPTHSLACGVGGRKASFDACLCCLDYDDGIIDHKPNGEHQRQQRDNVEGETQQRVDDKHTHQRYGYRHQRDECSTPILQEDVDDGNDEHQCQQQCAGYILHARFDVFCGIDNGVYCNAVGQSLLLLTDKSLDTTTHLHGVARWLLIDDNQCRGVAPHERAYGIGLAAKLHLGHILKAQLLPLLVDRKYDVGKLLGCRVGRRQTHRIGVGHILHRLGTQLASRVDGRLRAYGTQHIVNRKSIVMQPFGVDPYTHGIFARTHDLHLAHAIYLRETIAKVDIGVVRQKSIIVAPIATEGIDHQKTRVALLHHNTLLAHSLGQRCHSRGDVVLREDSIHVGR